MEKKKKEDILHVRVSKATKVVWEGEAYSVSSKNSDGPFDILGMHSNFITLVRNDPIVIVDTKKEKKTYTFNQSVVFVTDNVVRIFADIV